MFCLRLKDARSVSLPPIRTPSNMDSIRSKRFFDALVKPKHESSRIGVVSSSQEMKDGAIFSSLPIYKVFLGKGLFFKIFY